MPFLLKAILLLIAGYILLCAVYFLIQEKIIFLPEKLPENYTYQMPKPFEELFISTAEGVKINALYFKKAESKGIIIYFHGNAGSLARWGEVVNDFSAFPYDFFIYDYRTYGKSTGVKSEDGMLHDAQFIVKYLKQFYKEEDMILYGRSLGSGLASYCGTLFKVKTVILETPYYNLYDVARHYAPFVPYKLLMKYSFRSDQYVQKIDCPVYIFHGTKDKIIPYSSAEKLAKKLKPKDKFITIPNGRHNNLADFDMFQIELKKALLK